MVKCYDYITLLIPDRGFLDDPEFLAALNEQGRAEKDPPCPWCGNKGTCKVWQNGWRHKADSPKGATMQAVLLERETEFACSLVGHNDK
jgi:hypothetical protein